MQKVCKQNHNTIFTYTCTFNKGLFKCFSNSSINMIKFQCSEWKFITDEKNMLNTCTT